MHNIAYRVFGFIERKAGYICGKGYGTSSIKHEVRCIQRPLRSTPKIAVDVGGNVGEYSAELLKQIPNLEIHIFEPSSCNVARLKNRFAKDNRVTILPFALSNTAGVTPLFFDKPGSGLASLTKRKLDHFGIEFCDQELISTIQFEKYWESKLQSKIIDIVKLDIEGHELSALVGFGRALHSINALQFEFGGCNIDTKTYFQDFWYFFSNLNFDIYRITPLGIQKIERYTENDEFFVTCNYLAVNRIQR